MSRSNATDVRPQMRPSDLLGMAFSALGRHKSRTVLSLLGVAIGTFALVMSLAVGRGVDRAIVGLFRGTDALRQVMIWARYDPIGEPPESVKKVEGAMSDAKRERIRKAQSRMWARRAPSRPKVRIDRDGLDRLARLPHVAGVVPSAGMEGKAELVGVGGPIESNFASADPDGTYRRRIVAGRALASEGTREAIVHEFLLYRLGLRGDDDVRRALGQKLRFEFRIGATPRNFTLARLLTFGPQGFSEAEGEAASRALQRLAPAIPLLPIPAAERAALAKLLARTPAGSEELKETTYSEGFTIVGVIRESSEEDDKNGNILLGNRSRDTDILLPAAVAADFSFRAPAVAEEGVNDAVLTVDDDANVREVTKAVEDLGYSQNSLVQVVETTRTNVLLISLATAFIAVVALSVAAIGIANTMVMSVLERTHEIGIMKALGARTGQVRTLFLVEGATIGALGGGLGLLLSWLISYPADDLARSIMQAQAPRPVEGPLFAFPAWLVVGAPVLSAAVATLAAAYPAHRAARLDPITSLRHE